MSLLATRRIPLRGRWTENLRDHLAEANVGGVCAHKNRPDKNEAENSETGLIHNSSLQMLEEKKSSDKRTKHRSGYYPDD